MFSQAHDAASSSPLMATLFGVFFVGHSYPITNASFTQVDATHWVRLLASSTTTTTTYCYPPPALTPHSIRLPFFTFSTHCAWHTQGTSVFSNTSCCPPPGAGCGVCRQPRVLGAKRSQPLPHPAKHPGLQRSTGAVHQGLVV